MTEHDGTFSNSGVFSIFPDHELYGTLSLTGPSSVLRLWSNCDLGLESYNVQTITGVLDDQKRVSLIDCLKLTSGRRFGEGHFSHSVEFFPHYAIVGSQCFSYSDEFISNVSIVVDDATTLFCDRWSFGSEIIKSNDMEKLRSLESFKKVPFEYESPIVGYFTGKREIFSAQTVIGAVSAWNLPGISLGGPAGVHIRNKITVDLDFATPVNISELEIRIGKMLRFLEIIVGRPQNLLEVKISHINGDRHESSSVFLNMHRGVGRGLENDDRGFYDILIDAVREPDEFASLMSAWLRRDDTWQAARFRFSEGWRKQSEYDPDRIVGSANMFDLLPSDAIPVDTPLPNDVDEAVKQFRECFVRLRKSPKRDAVLSFLGRVRKQSLKEKIRYRSRFITDVIGDRIKELDQITDAAVELRNFYVHGDSPDRGTWKLEKFLSFLTNTLEFVFCASDLVELGWDLNSWYRRPKLAGHPFSNYVHSYDQNFSAFKSHYKSSG